MDKISMQEYGAKLEEFKELVKEQFSDELQNNDGDWEESGRLMDDHWEALLETMRDEVSALTQQHLDMIEQLGQPFADEEDHGLTAAERNPRLR
jgi:hypothetical protein